MNSKQKIKTYSDTYLYQQFPLYSRKITDAIMKDPVIDKSTDQFQDVIYSIKRAKVSDALEKILQSRNIILLDCDNPMPRSFKVFAARDLKSPDKSIKVFIDSTNVIEKDRHSSELIVDQTKLIAYLINAAIVMDYHKRYYRDITTRASLVKTAAEAFAKAFTFIIDYLAKISIQESNKVKVLYLSSMYFTEGVMCLDNPKKSKEISKKIAGISDRESNMLDVLLSQASMPRGEHLKDYSPFENIKTFVNALRELMHFNKKVISTDMIVERWMQQYGPGTVFGLEYFPAFSAMVTDAYVGGYINQQKSIEKILGTTMVEYSKEIISLVDQLA